MHAARLSRIALAVGLLTTSFGVARPAFAVSTYDDGYRAGFAAALQAARQAIEQGRSLESLHAPAGTAPQPDLYTAPSTAPSAAPPAAAAHASVPSADAEPRDWWNHSSLRYPLRDQAWRHGGQLDLSYTGVTGNDDGAAWRANAAWYARLGRWTNELSLKIDNRDIVSASGAVNRRDFALLQESLRYDLTGRWYLAGGFIAERDDMALIDSRATALFGTGYYWIDQGPFRLNTYAAIGYFDERYMDYVRDHVEVDGRNSGLLYLYQTFSWKISERVSLRQGLRLMWDADRSGRYALDPTRSTPPGPENPQGFERYSAVDWVRRYRSVAAIDIDYRLAPGVAASFGIERRYDSNPWPDVMRADTVKRVSLRLTF